MKNSAENVIKDAEGVHTDAGSAMSESSNPKNESGQTSSELRLDLKVILPGHEQSPPVAERRNIEAAFDRFLQAVLPHDQEYTNSQVLSVFDAISGVLRRRRDEMTSKVPPLPEQGSNDFERYSDDSQSEPLSWLRQHWGAWLKYFNTTLDKDYLFLDQLGKLDPALKKALYAKRRSILSETGLKISEIVPKKSVRIQQEVEAADEAQLKDAMRLYGNPRARGQRRIISS